MEDARRFWDLNTSTTTIVANNHFCQQVVELAYLPRTSRSVQVSELDSLSGDTSQLSHKKNGTVSAFTTRYESRTQERYMTMRPWANNDVLASNSAAASKAEVRNSDVETNIISAAASASMWKAFSQTLSPRNSNDVLNYCSQCATDLACEYITCPTNRSMVMQRDDQRRRNKKNRADDDARLQIKKWRSNLGILFRTFRLRLGRTDEEDDTAIARFHGCEAVRISRFIDILSAEIVGRTACVALEKVFSRMGSEVIVMLPTADDRPGAMEWFDSLAERVNKPGPTPLPRTVPPLFRDECPFMCPCREYTTSWYHRRKDGPPIPETVLWTRERLHRLVLARRNLERRLNIEVYTPQSRGERVSDGIEFWLSWYLFICTKAEESLTRFWRIRREELSKMTTRDIKKHTNFMAADLSYDPYDDEMSFQFEHLVRVEMSPIFSVKKVEAELRAFRLRT